MRSWQRPQPATASHSQPRPATASHSQPRPASQPQPASQLASQLASQPQPAAVSYSYNSRSHAQPIAARHCLQQPAGPRNQVPDSQPRIRFACRIRVSFHWLGRMQNSKAQCSLRRLRQAFNAVPHPGLRRVAPSGTRHSPCSKGVAWSMDFHGFRDFGAGRPRDQVFCGNRKSTK